MLLLVSPPSELWETSAEIPYWRCIITQIWVVLLIGHALWEIDLTNQKHFSEIIWLGNQQLSRQMSAVFSAYLGIRWKHLLIASQDIHISWDPLFQKGHFTISEVSCSHGLHWAILRLCSRYTGWYLFACWHEKLTGLAWTAKAQNCNKSFTHNEYGAPVFDWDVN